MWRRYNFDPSFSVLLSELFLFPALSMYTDPLRLPDSSGRIHGFINVRTYTLTSRNPEGEYK
jgi:hypothetical protein